MKTRRIVIGLVIIAFCLGINKFIKVKFTYKNNLGNIVQAKSNVGKEIKSYSKEDKQHIEYIRKEPKDVNIPILMYHSISSGNSVNNLLVPPEQFEEQIQWLKENGFTPLFMDEVIESFKTGKVPKRPVAITFDDGYVDNYTDAYRILKKYNMKGTFFVIGDCIGQANIYLTMDMLKEMKENGMAIESHTLNHLVLKGLSKEEKIKSIKGGQEFLKKHFGIESKYLCYPVGRYDEETIEIAKELGIEAAVTTTKGFANVDNGLYSLKRVRMAPMDMRTFKEIFKSYMK
ncbi:polysaccharide deacetylase family protein [Hathewaya massiliensis]|uniref:polysaccharide deacetylase family protein n=1 Tax=Hathewaya massiliensis TaxID=1964382 RepID=UPI001FAA8ECC|nr:polysaccharide deacetylase family protein [Hathewaya massiliensis]